MEGLALLVLFIAFLFALGYAASKLADFINRDNLPFVDKTEFFIKKINVNDTKSNFKLPFKSLFFLTLEDYLNHYYFFKPWKKAVLKKYLLENYDDISQREDYAKESIKEVMIGHFMEKKSYATGKSWITVGPYDSPYLENAAEKSFAKVSSIYPLNIIR